MISLALSLARMPVSIILILSFNILDLQGCLGIRMDLLYPGVYSRREYPGSPVLTAPEYLESSEFNLSL